MSSSSSPARVSTAALLLDDSRLVLVRRPPGGDLGGRWELPGGKVDPGESPEQALARELAEELNLSAVVGRRLAEVEFEHQGEQFVLQAYRVSADLSKIRLIEHVAIRRAAISEALELELAPSDRRLLQKLDPALLVDGKPAR